MKGGGRGMESEEEQEGNQSEESKEGKTATGNKIQQCGMKRNRHLSNIA